MTEETVHLFVLDTMADWEVGYVVAGLNQPMYQAVPGRYRVSTVGATRAPVRTMGGVTIVPDLAVEELDPAESAMLVLPGGLAWDEGEPAGAGEAAEAFLAAGVPVAAICGATAGLARRGLLDTRTHTSNAAEYLAMQPGYAGGGRYVSQPAVRDRDLVTASGTAPVEFAREVFTLLDVYAPAVLDAWFRLYRLGDASAFQALAAGDG